MPAGRGSWRLGPVTDAIIHPVTTALEGGEQRLKAESRCPQHPHLERSCCPASVSPCAPEAPVPDR